MSSILFGGQSIDVPVQSGESFAVSAAQGTYSLSIISGTGIGALATSAAGSAVYGPYTPGNVVRVTASIGAIVDFKSGVNPTLDYRPVATRSVPVAGNKTITSADLEQIVDVSALANLTIPTDAALGIAPGDRITVGAYQMTANALTWVAGSGVSPLRGTAPTAAQYLVSGLLHVGLNEWAYL